MATTWRGKLQERTVKTEIQSKFPCKANCLESCGDHLCLDSTCRAPPIHDHVTLPCQDVNGEKWVVGESSSWTTLTTDEIHAEYEVEEAALLMAAEACISDFCPSQRRYFCKMIDDVQDKARMILWYPKCLDWSVDDVCNYIKSLGFPHTYENCFRKNAIDGNKLYLCNSNRLVDMGIRDWKDIRVITAAIRQLLKIGYQKEEPPLKQSRISVQSLYEFWLRKRAHYSLGNEERAKNYGFREFLNEYDLASPETDIMPVVELSSQILMDRIMNAGIWRRRILIQELRSEVIPHWIENKNEVFLIKGVASMPANVDATVVTGTGAALSASRRETTTAEGRLKMGNMISAENAESPSSVTTISTDNSTGTKGKEVHFVYGKLKEPDISDVEEGSEEEGREEEGREEEGREGRSSNKNFWVEVVEEDGPPSVNVIAPEAE